MEHARQRVDVRTPIDRSALEAFRGHVPQRAQRVARRRQACFLGGAGQPEVDQVGEVARRHQDVRRLDVTVDQTGLVGGVQRRGHLLHHRDGVGRGDGLLGLGLGEHLTQRATLDQPHVQVEPAVDLAEAVDGDDVRVVDPGGGLRFAAKALLEDLVLGHVVWQDLERDDAVGPGVVGLIDLAHSAPAQQLLQLVVPEWCRIHR